MQPLIFLIGKHTGKGINRCLHVAASVNQTRDSMLFYSLSNAMHGA